MREVYKPANTVEAHMLVHLLEQNGIGAFVQGEALSGAAGELPVGVLRLEVPDDDWGRARKLLLDWEQRAAATAVAETPPRRRFPTGVAVAAMLAGLLGGFFLRDVLNRPSVTFADGRETADQNVDGEPDLTWFYKAGAQTAYKVEADTNFDGAVDSRATLDETGAYREQEGDFDFDGVFETRITYEFGNPKLLTTDLDRDGFPDSRSFFEHGVLVREEIKDDAAGVVATILHYRNLRLDTAEVDLNRDGFRETLRTFDKFGEIVATETRTPPPQ